MPPKSKTMWVPSGFNAQDNVFFMSATHRGDMYHVRAAMQFRKYSLILHGTTDKTVQVQEYLRKSALTNNKHAFEVPWSYETLTGATKPSIAGVLVDGKPLANANDLKRVTITIHSESDATFYISKQGTISADMIKFMALLTPASKTALDAKFKELYKTAWGIDEPYKATILAMYRDTGAKGGVYPELDTGDMILELNNAIKPLPENGDKLKIKVLSCGNKDKIADDIPTLGEYWLKLDPLKPKDETARDVEAYFLYWSFINGYFQMACGLRSGPFDLFTFMGIPTISIGLNHMIGESRHVRLAKETFKRINVQYDQPRHKATAHVKPRQAGNLPQMTCPFWDGQCPDGATKRDIPGSEAAKKQMRDQPPGPYMEFDKEVLKTAFKLACQRYMKGAEVVSFLKYASATIVGTRETRYAYPTNLAGADRKKYCEVMRKSDEKDIKARLDANSLQEPKALRDEWEAKSKLDWNDVFAMLGAEEEEDEGDSA